MSLLLATLAIFSPILLGLGALFLWAPRYRARIGEPPVREYMLRQPGETQRRKIAELNEKIWEDLVLLSAGPAVLAATYLAQQMERGWVAGSHWWVPALGSLALLWWRGRAFWRRFTEMRNRELGYDGERLVGERLAPLAAFGHFIFHDCPADGHGNIDHILITPSMVYAIETKTRRKRPSPSSPHAPSVVIYDGRSLTFPHGREDFGLDQARRQARWLSELLSQALAEPVPVQAALALPGWMVQRTGRGDVAVLNPKQFPALVRDKAPAPLNSAAARRMQQIAFVLEQRCRDVVFGHPGDRATPQQGKSNRPHDVRRLRAAKDLRRPS